MKNLQKIGQITSQLSITTQLFTTRMNQLLKEYDFNLTQFGLLNHMVRQPEKQHTISKLTQEMELNQSAVSKIIQKLQKMELVTVQKDAQDARKKWISITKKGVATTEAIQMKLGPDIAQWFAAWSEQDLTQFLASLQRISHWLDEHRLP